MSQEKKLSIRVQLPPDQEWTPKEEIVYHWNRIIGACIALGIVVTILIGSGLYLYTQAPDAQTPYTHEDLSLAPTSTSEQLAQIPPQISTVTLPNPDNSTQPISPSEELVLKTLHENAQTPNTPNERHPTDPLPTNNINTSNTTLNLAEQATDTTTHSTAQSITKHHNNIATHPKNSELKTIAQTLRTKTGMDATNTNTVGNINADNTPTTAATANHTPPPAEKKPLVIEKKSLIETQPLAKKEPLTTSKPSTKKIADASPSPFKQSKAEVFSEHIRRFTISQKVKDHEPIGNISDIHFDENNIATVYAYSDAIGLKDDTLYYKWFLDGKEIAKVKVSVWSNRWRSYSSKFIQPNMQGNWTVELQNKKGDVLAVNHFQY
jgi:hypothetical protein